LTENREGKAAALAPVLVEYKLIVVEVEIPDSFESSVPNITIRNNNIVWLLPSQPEAAFQSVEART
jgi:hypothetical protein